MYFRYVIRRVLAGILMYCLLIFMYSALFNTVQEKTLRSSIDEMIKAEKLTFLKKNKTADAKKFETERREYYYELNHMNDPFVEKVFWRGIKTITLDFGQSTVMTSRSGEKDVVKIVGEAVPLTVLLFTTSQIFIMIIALGIGLKKAQNPGKKIDKSTSLITMILFGMPTWWVGMMFIMFFGYTLKIFPTGGIHSVPPPETPIAYFLDFLHHLSLPVITLVVIGCWGTSFIVRNIVLGTLQEDFIMAARARGIGETSVLYSHTMRTAAPPIMTMVLLSLLASFGGSLIFESIFSWPGMGNLYLIANQQNDIPVIMGNLAVTTGLYISGLVFLDLIYGFLDPRIKVGR